MIRFHLDEHIHPGIVVGLRTHGVDVTTTQDAGLLSASDEDQLAFMAHGRVMVTNDRDFLRLVSKGREHPGMAYCHREKYTVGEHLHLLLLLHDCYGAAEMAGRVEYL